MFYSLEYFRAPSDIFDIQALHSFLHRPIMPVANWFFALWPCSCLCSAGYVVFTNESGERVYSPGDTAWVLASAALVWIMIPGVGFFYSGLLRYVYRYQSFCLWGLNICNRRKNALSMIYLSVMTLAVVSFQVHIFRRRSRDSYLRYNGSGFSGASP